MKCTSSESFSAQEVLDAYERIKPYIYRTPLEESLYLGKDGRRYFFKLECAQTVKSFKLRGALSKMTTLTEEERRRGVATISSGNHGASVSYAAQLLGIENAVVIVPETTPKAKVDKIRFYGAQAMLLGQNYDEAHRLGMAYIEEHGMTYIDAYYDDPKIYGGQGTIALEILEQNPQIDTIVVPIGGGGLSTGIAVYAKSVRPDIRVVGVQTEVCPAMIRAFADDVFYEEYPVTGDTVCDALVGGVGKLAFEILRDYIDDIIEVKEATIRKAVKYMIKEEKYIVEGASAATVAAVMDNRDRVGGQNVALVMSGGNIDGDLMVQLLNA
ncbi:MAG: threonine/serine dehydratase [Anaerovoracaceae bacterium]